MRFGDILVVASGPFAGCLAAILFCYWFASRRRSRGKSTTRQKVALGTAIAATGWFLLIAYCFFFAVDTGIPV